MSIFNYMFLLGTLPNIPQGPLDPLLLHPNFRLQMSEIAVVVNQPPSTPPRVWHQMLRSALLNPPPIQSNRKPD